MEKIRIAIAGLGNCASSLLQGIEYYRDKDEENSVGLMHWDIGGYKPFDIEIVAAFDIDDRKVGRDANEAIFALPNNTTVFCDKMPLSGVKVQMGKVLDGYSDHMKNYDEKHSFVLSSAKESSKEQIVSTLVKSGAEMLLNYLPVGSLNAHSKQA
jgi:myo-inositol-1-phosphate synthase